MKYKCVKQYDSTDCASACLASIAWFNGKKIPAAKLRESMGTNRDGTSILDVCQTAEKIGLLATAYKRDKNFSEEELVLPCIAHVYQEDGLAHYIVIYEIERNKIIIADPAIGIIKIDRKKFFQAEFTETSSYYWTGFVIGFEMTENFKKENNRYETQKNKFLELLNGEWKKVVYIAILSSISMGISIITSFYFGMLIDKIIPNRLMYTLIFMTIVVVFFSFLKTIFDWYRAKIVLSISKSFNLKLSLKYFTHLLNLKMYSLGMRKNGEFISRFQDVARIQEALVESILILPIDILFIFVTSIIMCIMNFKIFSVVLIMCVMYAIVMIGFRKYYSVLNSEVMENEARVTSHLIDAVEGIQTIKAYTYTSIIFRKGEEKIQKWQSKILELGSIENFQVAIKSIIGGIGEVVVLCIGAFEIMNGNLSIGELVTYNILIGYLIRPIKDVINLQPVYHSAQIAMERLTGILDITPEQENGKNIKFQENINFNNVSFGFNTRDIILDNINLNIKKGDKISIVGETGSGKTSLAKLLMKFYIPDKGGILLDYKDINCFGVNELRKAIAYVSQEDFLFSGSIKENLKMGDESITDKDMIHLAQKTGMDIFVRKLERGYDTIIEERGQNFSKGQRQKIALTRALLRTPKILILDEATSNIDCVSERQILNYIKNLNDLTLILISHKINTISDCDQIYVLENGKIVAHGTNDQLKQQCEIYRQYCSEEEL